MMHYCCVPECKAAGIEENVTFHSFPREKEDPKMFKVRVAFEWWLLNFYFGFALKNLIENVIFKNNLKRHLSDLWFEQSLST